MEESDKQRSAGQGTTRGETFEDDEADDQFGDFIIAETVVQHSPAGASGSESLKGGLEDDQDSPRGSELPLVRRNQPPERLLPPCRI